MTSRERFQGLHYSAPLGNSGSGVTASAHFLVRPVPYNSTLAQIRYGEQDAPMDSITVPSINMGTPVRAGLIIST